jgi:8-hydroxy-5-deazaflavin:NADPH oxidoreductase
MGEHLHAATSRNDREPSSRMRIVVIGSGRIGGTLTRRLAALGHDVVVANARGPETLEDLAHETGATATSTADLPADADVVVLAIPLAAIPDLPPLPGGAVVVDAANYVPGMRDPEIPAIEAGEPESTWTAEQLGRPVIKALNTITARSQQEHGRPRGAADRIAAPVAGDDEEAKQRVIDLVDALGFDAFDSGNLADSWRQQPGTPVYTADLALDAARSAIDAARPEQSTAWRDALRATTR